VVEKVSGVDLVRWLGVQLDEDERIARAAGERVDPDWGDDEEHVYSLPHGYPVAFGSVDSYMDGGLRTHIAEHDPARVLRETDTKRRQVEWCVEVIGARDLSRYDEVGSLKDDKDALAVTLAVETLRLLALPYDGRDGYQEAWRPSE